MDDGQNTIKSPHAKSQKTQPTIGFMIERSVGQGDYHNSLWNGIADAAEEQDVNVLCFMGGTLYHSPVDPFESQRNVLYDLAGPVNVDGLIISATLGSFASREEFEGFFDRYCSLPVVGISVSRPNNTGLLVDNYGGMRDAVAHLIQVHGYRRVAFVRGPETNEEAELRYRAYTDVLTEHGLPLDPDLVAPGSFVFSTGVEAVCLLLDERKVALEAIVAANDDMALGVMEALQARGLRVPDDIAVVGFDDVREASATTPMLTTVRQPIHRLGEQALETLLALLRGEQVPAQVTLPTELVVRQSCGCSNAAVVQAGVVFSSSHSAGEGLEHALAEKRKDMVSEMVHAVTAHTGGGVSGPSSSLDSEQAEQLLESILAELVADPIEGTVPSFLQVLYGVLRQIEARGDTPLMDSAQGVLALHDAISALRRNLLPYLDNEVLPRAEALWHQARVMIGNGAERARALQMLQFDQQMQSLRQVGQSLITTFDIETLMDVLSEELPDLGIHTAYVSLYIDPQNPANESRLMMAYDEVGALHRENVMSPNGRRELAPDRCVFPSPQLVPEGTLPQNRQYTMIVESLYFQAQQLGFVLFQVGPRNGTIYDTLSGEISSALQGALLLQAQERAEATLQEAYAKVEEQVQEKTAELQRETAERERLQQEIIEAQKQALQELSAPVIPVMDRIIVMPLIGSIDTMRARDITRSLLAGIREQRAKVVILDITGVPLVDSGVASHLNKTIQAARLKGARTIITGISDAVAETIVDLGIDWSGIQTLPDLQTGLAVALKSLGVRLTK